MAVKTITIDTEAYSLLAAAKRGKESFSLVIKRTFAPSRTAGALLHSLDEILLNEETLGCVEELISRRDESLAKSPILEAAPDSL